MVGKTEYRVEVKGSGEWFAYNDVVFDTIDRAKNALSQAEGYYPTKSGYQLRIAVRVVGDWCEMKGTRK